MPGINTDKINMGAVLNIWINIKRSYTSFVALFIYRVISTNTTRKQAAQHTRPLITDWN